tara:strand:+ start:1057 stop:1692 length:636 start_codon:yes stop_codon:yes gene_type:complete
MLVKEAKTYGNISKGNTKMPGTTFAIDAFACITGSKLAKIEGTPCHSCYARKLQKLRPSVDQGWKANLTKWQKSDKSMWVFAMVFQIERYNTDGYHRWFDSGDLQSVEMLKNIVDVALLTPKIQHWLPTQERSIVKQYRKQYGEEPSNLVIRVSASKVDAQKAPDFANTSTVFKNKVPIGKVCKANTRGNQCGPCRACWDANVKTVSYPKH